VNFFFACTDVEKFAVGPPGPVSQGSPRSQQNAAEFRRIPRDLLIFLNGA
jgi:hypothetical protein